MLACAILLQTTVRFPMTMQERTATKQKVKGFYNVNAKMMILNVNEHRFQLIKMIDKKVNLDKKLLEMTYVI